MIAPSVSLAWRSGLVGALALVVRHHQLVISRRLFQVRHVRGIRGPCARVVCLQCDQGEHGLVLFGNPGEACDEPDQLARYMWIGAPLVSSIGMP